MKDRIMAMYDHIAMESDVDIWALKELRKVVDAYLADGCSDCAYYDVEEWNMPCAKCKRNTKDYWRKEVDNSGSKVCDRT